MNHHSFAMLESRRALAETVRLAGFEPEDFEVSEGAPAGLQALGLPDRLLTVRRRSTGHRQLYATVPGSPWLFNAFADLTAGRFGRPGPGKPARSRNM